MNTIANIFAYTLVTFGVCLFIYGFQGYVRETIIPLYRQILNDRKHAS